MLGCFTVNAVSPTAGCMTRNGTSGDALRSQSEPPTGSAWVAKVVSAIGAVADRWPWTELTRCLHFTLVVEALSGANPSQTIGPQCPPKRLVDGPTFKVGALVTPARATGAAAAVWLMPTEEMTSTANGMPNEKGRRLRYAFDRTSSAAVIVSALITPHPDAPRRML